ncbi:MAG: hypothetical protein AABY27_06770 [Pseudomonadota bacterium]
MVFERPSVDARIYAIGKLPQYLNAPPGPNVRSHNFGKVSEPIPFPGDKMEIGYGDIKLRPINVFDSKEGEFRDIESITDSNRFINPRRLARGATDSEDSSNKGHEYYYTDGSGSIDYDADSKSSSVSGSYLETKKYWDEKHSTNAKEGYTPMYWREESAPPDERKPTSQQPPISSSSLRTTLQKKQTVTRSNSAPPSYRRMKPTPWKPPGKSCNVYI